MSSLKNKTPKKRRTYKKKRANILKRIASKITFKGLIKTCFFACIFGGIGYLTATGWVTDKYQNTRATLISQSAAQGLFIENIFVDGRVETSQDALLALLNVAYGAPILSYDIESAQNLISRLNWVETVRIERHLPNSLNIYLTERTPYAIWQNDEQLQLIDASHTILSHDTNTIARFENLPLLIGSEAPDAYAILLPLLNNIPELTSRAQTYHHIGRRRWNIRFNSGTLVKFPPNLTTQILLSLAELQQEDNILDRGLSIIDLRQPDRAILRLSGGDLASLTPLEEETTEDIIGNIIEDITTIGITESTP